jgi:hypothetical protein|tara:strand:- start:13224 stop:13454 length:231 start_codon:yes stop_codon:yes gene_type:complete
MERLRLNLKRKASQADDIEDGWAKAIFYVEKEVNQHIDEDYLMMKFTSQFEHLKEHIEAEEREMNKAQRGTPSTLG